ncbi:DUF805 domain-containing protein [Candidatus Poribacteria bacterium]|nr:DUF805 domain-containing protein [Candidatus Poribacteria bacterium]
MKKLIFSFSGRINRKTFWLCSILWLICFLFYITFIAFLYGAGYISVFFYNVLFIWGMLTNAPFCIKRYQDRGKPAGKLLKWSIIWGSVAYIANFSGKIAKQTEQFQITGEYNLEPVNPYDDPLGTFAGIFFLGVFVFIIIACGCRKGMDGPNQYGERPNFFSVSN